MRFQQKRVMDPMVLNMLSLRPFRQRDRDRVIAHRKNGHPEFKFSSENLAGSDAKRRLAGEIKCVFTKEWLAKPVADKKRPK